jgi:hypothetical protein
MMPNRSVRRRFASLLLVSALVSLGVVAASCADVIGLDGVDRVACVIDCGVPATLDGQLPDVATKNPEGGMKGDSGSPGCTNDSDCHGAANPRCDLNSGACVACLPLHDNCPIGMVCKLFAATYACAMGCDTSADCPKGDGGATLSCCDDFCVDALTNAANCGKCGQSCSMNNMATVTCGAGVCNGTCAAGYADCNGNKLTDGCETSIDGTDIGNCGGCGTACSPENMATVTCGAGVCNGTCTSGYADCDSNKQTDGCETLVGGTDIGNCGGCGVSCSSNGMASVTCGGGACNGTCVGGYANCDGNLQSNGCEVCIDCSDINNCGACGYYCPSYGYNYCSGSTCYNCPFIFAFDGHSFAYETTVGGASVVGKKAHVKEGKSLDFEPMWARLDHSMVDFSSGVGAVRSKVIAAEDEIVYLDQASLTAIEHPVGYEVVSSSAIEWQQTLKRKDPQEFYVLRTAALRAPVQATWMGRVDVTDSLSVKDEVAAAYDVRLANHYDLDFGSADGRAARWLVIEGWKVKQPRDLAPGVPRERPRLDVRQADGSWAKAVDLATPRGDAKAAAFDLSSVTFPTGRYEMRIVTGTHEDGHAMWYLDRVRLTLEPALAVHPLTVALTSATLSFMRPPSVEGESEKWHPMRATDDGRGDLSTKHLTFGSFTRYGDVRDLLAASDDRMVVMRRGDGVELRFAGVPRATPGHEVTVFLETDLLFKPHEMFGETSPILEEVEPLPYHGMGHYPPPAPFPSDEPHREWRATYETRVYERGDTRWGP